MIAIWLSLNFVKDDSIIYLTKSVYFERNSANPVEYKNLISNKLDFSLYHK